MLSIADYNKNDFYHLISNLFGQTGARITIVWRSYILDSVWFGSISVLIAFGFQLLVTFLYAVHALLLFL